MKRILALIILVMTLNMFAADDKGLTPIINYRDLKKREAEKKKETPKVVKKEVKKPAKTEPKREKVSRDKIKKTDLLDLDKLPENVFYKINRLNVNDLNIKDVLRGIAVEYKINLIVEESINKNITISLSDISVIDCILFLCDEYNLDIHQNRAILRITDAVIEKETIGEIEPNEIIIHNDTLTVDFKNKDVQHVLKTMSKLSGKNIVFNNSIQGRINGFLRNVDFEAGLKILMENSGFTLNKKNGIYYVTVDAQAQNKQRPGSARRSGVWITVNEGKISFDVNNADITRIINDISQELDISIITYGSPKGTLTAKCKDLDINTALNIILKGTEFTYKEDNGIYVVGNKSISSLISSKLIKLKHIKADGITALIPETIMKNATLKVVKEQNALMVISTNDIIYDLESYIKQIDLPTPQILIEALVVDFNTSDIRDLGVMMGVNTALGDSSSSFKNYSLLDVGFDKDGRLYSQQNAHSLNKGLEQVSKWAGVKNIGVLPSNFYAKIQALESEGKANVKSKPQIATLNGHEANISVGTTQYYILKSTTPIKSNDDVITQESEKFEEITANVTLTIVPWVGSSGDVTVEVHPEFKTPVGSFNSSTPPTINERSLDSTVRLKDGETIIMGGLIQESNSKTFKKVPILGDIPLIKHLFRFKGRNNSKTELMIYITPHIFYGDENDSKKWELIKSEYEKK